MAGMEGWRAGIAVWFRPLGYLLVIAAVFILVPFVVDRTLLRGHRENLDWVQNLPEVFAGVIGIAITVVAIIVELAANRYTARITELFFKARVNSAVLAFYVVACVQCVWVSFQTSDAFDHSPLAGTYVCLGSVTLCLLLLLPYFAFVFDFLNPRKVIERLLDQVAGRVAGVTGLELRGLDRAKAEVIEGIEQLADVASNALEKKDKAISMDAVNAMSELVDRYVALKAELPAAWFEVSAPVRRNPDFVSMTPDTHEDLERRRLWLEMKVFRQYQMLYGEALNRMRDINYLIAINTRAIGERAIERGDEDGLRLGVKFFNTFLRQTVNARDVRTAYNVLNQYRLLAESALRARQIEHVQRISSYFKYYGLLAFNNGLPFILETVAYDLCALNELAYDVDAANKLAMLRDFLDVDKESAEEHEHEATLRGVRKAQVKLATYYLVAGAEDLAREVFADMESEIPSRLASIKQEMLQVRDKEFFEVIDRGVDFDWLEPPRREKLETFFGWFGESLGS